MKILRYKKLFNEIIDPSQFVKGSQYRSEVMKTFDLSDWKKYYPKVRELFKQLSPDGKFHQTLVFPFNSDTAKKSKSDIAKWKEINIDVKEILGTEGYTFNDQSFAIGICFNKQKKEVKISQVVGNIQRELETWQTQEDIKDRLKADLQNATLMAKLPPQAKKQKEDKILELKARKLWLDKKASSIEVYMGQLKKETGMNIVFTLSTRKIASQSTKTSWSSCMNLDAGINKHKVGSSIAGGAFTAWLTNVGDEVNLNGPLARVLIKPMESETGDIFWYTDLVYPRGKYAKFRQRVTEILEAHNVDVSMGEYAIDPEKHYVDSSSDIIVDEIFKYVQKGDFSDLMSKPREFIEKMFNNYSREVILNWDMSVPFPDIEIETLDLSNTDIRELPKGIKAKNYNLSNTNIEVFEI